MVKRCVRVYIEGGATGHASDSDFRQAWKRFLATLHETAREHGYHSLEVVRGKARRFTFDSFQAGRQLHPDDLHVLLVDSEAEVADGSGVWQIVSSRQGDGWTRPEWASEDHLYFMVQFVETWLVTDPLALTRFYGEGFRANVLPSTNLEQRSKAEIEAALKKATQDTRKGPYTHGMAHLIIGMVDPARVRALPHGERLFAGLTALIATNPVL